MENGHGAGSTQSYRGKAKSTKQPSCAERELKRNLKLRDQMRQDFMKTWSESAARTTYKGGPVFDHPYEKFRYTRIIVHRIEEDVYPDIDERPGIKISSRFCVEPYDFYHAGLKVILGIESGVIETGLGYAGNGKWAITKYEADFRSKRISTRTRKSTCGQTSIYEPQEWTGQRSGKTSLRSATKQDCPYDNSSSN
jgi:hypothetical protein